MTGRRDGERKEGNVAWETKGERKAPQPAWCKEAPLSGGEADSSQKLLFILPEQPNRKYLTIAPHGSTVSSDRTCSVWTRPQNRTERARNEVSVPLASLAESQKGLGIVLCPL